MSFSSLSLPSVSLSPPYTPHLGLLKLIRRRIDGPRWPVHIIALDPLFRGILPATAPLQKLTRELAGLLVLPQVGGDVVLHLERRLDVLQEPDERRHCGASGCWVI